MTPKAKFRANRTLTRGYNDLILGDQLQAAMDAAMLQMDQSTSLCSDMPSAAAQRWRKEGAITFRAILENLNEAETQTKTTNPAPGQLGQY